MTVQTRIDYKDALAIARSVALRLPVETIPLADALGRIAATDISAPFALPGFVNSAMDGYAIRAADLRPDAATGFRIGERILAGGPLPRQLHANEAAEIMTGAPLPEGADTVVIREVARADGETVWLPAGVVRGANVRLADDDCAAGTPVLSSGDVLTATRLSVLAAFGFGSVAVSRRPRIAVLVTGDELVAAGQPLPPGMRYDSNGILLSLLARGAGAQVIACEHCPDDPDALRTAIARLSREANMLLTSGGVSAGIADHLPDVIGSLGSIHFWKVRIKPGMPVLCASIDECIVFALPGNPVSSGVTFQMLARSSLDAMQGRTAAHGLIASARLSMSWRKTHDRTEFLRVNLNADENGTLLATPIDHQGSGALSRSAGADALAILGEGRRDYASGAIVDVVGLSPPYACV